jgi:hypothetical protein
VAEVAVADAAGDDADAAGAVPGAAAGADVADDVSVLGAGVSLAMPEA